MWEHGAPVVALKGGRYAIPVPDRIPPGIEWPQTNYPADISRATSDSEGGAIPMFLSPLEYDIWNEARSSGQAFSLIQGEDGFLHVVSEGEGAI